MLHAMTTLNLPVDDVAAARDWYAKVLGIDAYFQQPDAEQPAYAEFRIGPRQDELGLIDARYTAQGLSDRPAGATIYWHVDDVTVAVEELVALGATAHDPVVVRGDEGFVTASVVDPFGNVLGLMHSPHYLGQQSPAQTHATA